MAHTLYPRELAHPNGFRTVTVYSSEEERSVQADFSAFRRENDAAQQAAAKGAKAPARAVKKEAENV
ncbi:hypothetical protein [Gluconobacter cerinus]|uniref:Uncharacterized protein n=1 Tax=Gluconobacter cerinus TaxID=38307 RepID=A0A1B6VPQ1_9PROT|nr:hypothetical protein [Gluconobacter cerinus]OAJ69038.1 hypothetical protein A0123_00608 [Gluconobacter cerinus]